MHISRCLWDEHRPDSVLGARDGRSADARDVSVVDLAVCRGPRPAPLCLLTAAAA